MSRTRYRERGTQEEIYGSRSQSTVHGTVRVPGTVGSTVTQRLLLTVVDTGLFNHLATEPSSHRPTYTSVSPWDGLLRDPRDQPRRRPSRCAESVRLFCRSTSALACPLAGEQLQPGCCAAGSVRVELALGGGSWESLQQRHRVRPAPVQAFPSPDLTTVLQPRFRQVPQLGAEVAPAPVRRRRCAVQFRRGF